MSEYSAVVGGSLKLKNGARRKRKKSDDRVVDGPPAKKEKLADNASPTKVTEEAESSAAVVAEAKLTSSERSFQLVRRKREQERISKRIEMTHRQRMEKLNSHLATLSEHFDIPKVGPG
eukprot:CAMPEP_0113846028 /NCGR_PEP_ID=MMETSP0372-20130328/1078_1 /TAXON_ID=340204 /ORGANISM="Lankesteria abbotti" /LENGTH=118 /DNA_ID=CAMNT_0000815123 /DNA_START=167 /DNA_END=523 /DNA_ORIENTATION=- /assembly_acc=CAM_ASM_000359